MGGGGGWGEDNQPVHPTARLTYYSVMTYCVCDLFIIHDMTSPRETDPGGGDVEGRGCGCGPTVVYLECVPLIYINNYKDQANHL